MKSTGNETVPLLGIDSRSECVWKLTSSSSSAEKDAPAPTDSSKKPPTPEGSSTPSRLPNFLTYEEIYDNDGFPLVMHPYSINGVILVYLWDITEEQLNQFVQFFYNYNKKRILLHSGWNAEWICDDQLPHILIVVSDTQKSNRWESTLAHECFHATVKLLKRMDTDLSRKTEESYAYLLAYLVQLGHQYRKEYEETKLIRAVECLSGAGI